MLGIVTIISAALTAQMQPSPYVDASNADQAMTMVALEIGMIEEMRLYCGAVLPQSKRIVDYHALLWGVNNEQEVEAVESYLGTRDRVKYEAQLAPFIGEGIRIMKSGGASAGHQQICAGMMAQIRSGERNIESRTPNASTYLKEYLKDHPTTEPEAGRRNMFLGCVKQSFNKSVDLDGARMSCKCISEVVYQELTTDELAEFDRTAREHGDVSVLSSVVRVQDKLSACQGSLHRSEAGPPKKARGELRGNPRR